MAVKKRKDEDLEKMVRILVAKQKYPKREGGETTLSGDNGEVYIFNAGKEVHFDFSVEGKTIVYDLKSKGLRHMKSAPKKEDKGADKEVDKKGKKAPAPTAPPAKLSGKKPTVSLKPVPEVEKWVTHKGYNGQDEQVDIGLYKNRILCSVCGGVRYVKNADMFQVSKCKPCTRRDRRSRKRATKKLKS